jgi:hypothetical protein
MRSLDSYYEDLKEHIDTYFSKHHSGLVACTRKSVRKMKKAILGR